MKAGVWREEWRRNIQQLSHLLLAPLYGHQDDELMMLMKLTTFPIEIQYLPKIQIVLMALYLHRDIVEILLNDMNCSLKIWSVFDSNTKRNRLTNHKIKQLQTAADIKCVYFWFLSIRKDPLSGLQPYSSKTIVQCNHSISFICGFGVSNAMEI